MAIFRRGASPKGSWTGKRPFVARYRRHACEMSWFWQDMLSMYSKCPAKRRLGIHLAGILPSRRPFPVRIPQIMHNGQILPRFCNSAFCARFGARSALRFVLHCGIACSLREGASAVAGGASVAVRPLRGGVGAVICPFRGDASTATKKRVQPKVPSWVRSSRNAFLSGKSWQYFVAMHSRRGATGRGTPSQIRRRLRGR